MTRTLKLYLDFVKEACRLLNGFYFDDNGGEPDGDTWLPVQPLDESDPGVADILAAELGEMVNATYTDARTVVKESSYDGANYNAETAAWLAEAEGDEIYEAARGIVENIGNGWAGYFCGDVIVYVNF